MADLTKLTSFDSPTKEWGGEWHGFESRVREVERLANEFWFGNPAILAAVGDKHPALAEVEMVSQGERVYVNQLSPDQRARHRLEHAATPANVRTLLAHLQQPNIYFDSQSIAFDKAQITHLRTFVLQAADMVLAYFNTFSGRFSDALEVSNHYPPIHVNHTLMKRMATDLQICENAMQQRMRYKNNIQTWQGYGLYAADLVAYATIQPLKESGILSNETAIVTHMQRRTDVRMIPYYDLLFIGLPLGMINVYDVPPRPYLAIPHEIGHFLFRYGKVERNGVAIRIDQALASDVPTGWQRRWAEEIFADTFGCLMAGPVSILQFQALLADGDPMHLDDCDGKHPTPALRPLIQSEILREIARRALKSYVHTPDLLDSHWQLHLDRYVDKLSGNVLDKPFMIDGQSMTGIQIMTGARVVIQAVMDLFLALFRDTYSPAHWETWSSDIPVPIDNLTNFNSLVQAASSKQPLNDVQAHLLRMLMGPLGDQFQTFYFTNRQDPQRSNFRRGNVKPPQPVPDTQRPTTTYQQQVKTLQQRLQTWRHGDPRIPVADWESAFVVPGWSTEGPHAVDDQ